MKENKRDLIPENYLFLSFFNFASNKSYDEFVNLTKGLLLYKDEFLIKRSLLKESKALSYEINIFFGNCANTVNNVKAEGNGYLQVRRLILSNLEP